MRGEERQSADARHCRRELKFWYDDDGSLEMKGRLRPEVVAKVLADVDAAVDAHAAEQTARGDSASAR